MVQTSSWLLLRVWKEPALAKPILHDWRVRTGTVEEPNNSKKNKNFSGDPLKMGKKRQEQDSNLCGQRPNAYHQSV